MRKVRVQAYDDTEDRESVPENCHDGEGRPKERLEHGVESVTELVRLVLWVERVQLVVEAR